MLLRKMEAVPDFEVHTRLFRSQRNAYITGINLFLAFVLWRLMVILGPDAKPKAVQAAESPAPAEAKMPEGETKLNEDGKVPEKDESSKESDDKKADKDKKDD